MKNLEDGNPRLLNPTDRSTEERVGSFLFYIKLVWTFGDLSNMTRGSVKVVGEDILVVVVVVVGCGCGAAVVGVWGFLKFL